VAARRRSPPATQQTRVGGHQAHRANFNCSPPSSPLTNPPRDYAQTSSRRPRMAGGDRESSPDRKNPTSKIVYSATGALKVQPHRVPPTGESDESDDASSPPSIPQPGPNNPTLAANQLFYAVYKAQEQAFRNGLIQVSLKFEDGTNRNRL
jgi:hypothetical protein